MSNVENIRTHVEELRRHTNLGKKPKSVQPIRGEVYRTSGQTGENPVREHVNELQRQATLRREPVPLQPNPAEQQAAERLGKPPPEKVGEVQQEPAPHYGIDELRQLARQVLRPPLSPEQLEGIKPETFEEWARSHPQNAANYASAIRHYEETVENLARLMQTDPFTPNLLRRILHDRERSEPPEN